MSIELLKQYVEKVNRRGPKGYVAPYSSYRFIAEGMPTDMRNCGYGYDTDDAFLYHVENSIHDDEVMLGFKQFKRYYYAWRRRHLKK